MSQPRPLQLLEAMLSRYPQWRLGQAICNVAGWEDVEPADLSDDALGSAIADHLGRRYGSVDRVDPLSPGQFELIGLLNEVHRLEPGASLGSVVVTLSTRADRNPYDIEDDELIAAGRDYIAMLESQGVR